MAARLLPARGVAKGGESFDPPPKSQSHAALLDFLKAKSTGLTLLLTVALALGLSLAPVPEAFRPVPSLQRSGPLGPKLVALVLPASLTGKRPVRPPSDTMVAEAPVTPTLPPEEEEPDAGMDAVPALPLVPTTPGIGLEDLSAPTLARALELEALRERMGAQHVDIELNCRKGRHGRHLPGGRARPLHPRPGRAARRRPPHAGARGAPGRLARRVGPHHRPGAGQAPGALRRGRQGLPLHHPPGQHRPVDALRTWLGWLGNRPAGGHPVAPRQGGLDGRGLHLRRRLAEHAL
jgi:hypothetical protein